jgi:uncharacterized protein
MSSAPTIPGLYYASAPKPANPSPLRTDVAGFYGRTLRGPVGVPWRVKGWREYNVVFGGLAAGAMTTYALRGYFDNGGDVAYVVRVLGAKSQCASATWAAGTFNAATNKLDPDWPGAAGFAAIQFLFKASSPGDWANGTTIDVRYWARGSSGVPELEIEVAPPGEAAEILTGIDPSSIADEISGVSKYLQIESSGLPTGLGLGLLSASTGPGYFEWPTITLSGGTSVAPVKEEYLAALTALGDQIEVALVVCPDLYGTDLYNASDANRTANVVDVITCMLQQAQRLHDRLVVLDVPPEQADPVAAVDWIDTNFRNLPPPVVPLNESVLQNGAVYHPRLMVPDPLGAPSTPLVCVPCGGLVAGVISRLDQQEGAYMTPANAPIQEAVDLARTFDAHDQAAIYSGGLNLLTCSPSQGLLVWGGRVLGTEVPGGFVAHRRLIHLLVRAIRRVAEPLVFDPNGPQLWLAFVRSITTVLLEAYRAGALQGATPDQAFRVRCDATTNPPDQIDNGMVVCLVQVAPAVPMEFITLRIAVSAQGQLEVFES